MVPDLLSCDVVAQELSSTVGVSIQLSVSDLEWPQADFGCHSVPVTPDVVDQSRRV